MAETLKNRLAESWRAHVVASSAAVAAITLAGLAWWPIGGGGGPDPAFGAALLICCLAAWPFAAVRVWAEFQIERGRA